MTPAEADTLKRGDIVETRFRRFGKEWRKAQFLCIDLSRHQSMRLRFLGTKKNGVRYGSVVRNFDDVRFLPALEPVTGNIFADWLEEHGYPEAAHALREAFPLLPKS